MSAPDPTQPDPALLARWGLLYDGVAPVATTPRARVWKVWRADGQPAALKVLARPPHEIAAAAATRLLRAWAGRGAVRVLAATDRATLMEWLPGPSIGDLARQGRAADPILAAAVAALPPIGLADVAPVPSLRQTCAALLTLVPADMPRPSDRAALHQARDLCQKLLAHPAPARVLHGDIHHDNILHGPDGWRVIDPTPCVGDPAFEFGNVFRNPDGVAGLAQPHLIHRRAALGVRALSVPYWRILAWAAVRTGLSIGWSLESGAAPSQEDLALLRRLLTMTPLPGRKARPISGVRRDCLSRKRVIFRWP